MMRNGYAKLREGNATAAESGFMAAWERIPEPRYSWDISQLTVIRLAKFYLEIQKFDDARSWAARIHECGPNPADGEPFVLQGSVEFVAGRLGEARAFFARAFDVAGRRAFRGEDPRYLKLISK